MFSKRTKKEMESKLSFGEDDLISIYIEKVALTY